MSSGSDLTRVRVVIPVYNGYQYLRQCVLSVIEQDYENLEIVIIDDGSDTLTASVILDLKSEFPDKIMVRTHGSNLGATRALVTGLTFKNSNDSYLMTLAQDDCIPSSYVSCLVNEIEHKGSVAICSNLIPINESGEVLKGLIAAPLTAFLGKYQLAVIFGLNLINAPGCMIDGATDPGKFLARDYPYTHDMHLWLHLAAEGEISVARKTNCFYRINPKGISSRRDPSKFHVEVNESREDFLKSESFEMYLKKLNRIEKRLFYYLILFTTINESKCVHSNKWRKLLRELLQIPFQDASLPKSCVLAEVLPLTYANKSKKAEGKRNSVHNLFKSVSSLIRIFLYLLHSFTKSGKSK
jgi:teichuronic acid biosynthesis glycosyltransferase TuaG